MNPDHRSRLPPPAARSRRPIGTPVTRICLLLTLPALVTYVVITLMTALSGPHGPGGIGYARMQIEPFIHVNVRLSRWPMFWRNVTELGDALVVFPFLAFLVYRNPRVWVALFAAVPLSGLLSAAGKYLAAVPRPAAVLAPDQIHVLGPVLTAHNSLPSGHTITIFAVVTVVVGSLVSFGRGEQGWRWVVAGLLFASVVGLSRVAVGAHWPLDIVIGASLGIIGGASGIVLTLRYSRSWRWLLARSARGTFGVIMLVWGLVLGNGSLVGGSHELVVPWLAALCASSVGVYLLLTALLPRPSSILSMANRRTNAVVGRIEANRAPSD